MIVENSGLPSFQEIMRVCRLASEVGECVRVTIFGKSITVMPGANPHQVYRLEFPEMLSNRIRSRG